MTIYRIKEGPALMAMIRLIGRVNPDIIHVHAPNLFSSNAVIAAKLKKIPIVATVHRAEIDRVGKPMHLARKMLLSRFERIIAVSDFTRSLAIKAGVKENKISVIYNACDENIFSRRDKSMAREHCGLPKNRKIILFVGNLIEIKGIYVLIRALRIIRSQNLDFLAIIIGHGEERQNLEALIKEHSLDNNIRLQGWLPQSELAYFYNAADIFVLPSFVEGHSVALLEAMASGLPIVASKIGGNLESVENNVNGFHFEKGNENELAEKLIKLLSDDALCTRLSCNSYEIYSRKFSAKTQLKGYFEIYNSIMQRETSTTILLMDNRGLSHYTSYLSKGLANYHKVILCGFSEEEYTITGAKENGVLYYKIEGKMQSRGSMISNALKPLLLLFPLFKAFSTMHYDIVHIQGHLPLFFLFIPYLKLKRKKICWTIHDINLRPSSLGVRGKLELRYVNILTRPEFVGRSADSIIVHGAALKRQLISKGINQEKIFVIPHFDYDYLLDSKDTPDAGEYVLVFGRIKPYKGIDVLIDAAKAARKMVGPRFKILIAGKGDSTYFAKLLGKEESEYICIRNEFIPNSEIPRLFRKAKFLVLPYTDASQSGVLSLAYTFSKPVIVSNVGSMPEYVAHGETGFIFESHNSTELAGYIIELLRDETKCIEMGKRARLRLMHEMSLEKCCEIINDIYTRH
jgi:glycosyltransferase involved in cell wall biosynthesis